MALRATLLLSTLLTSTRCSFGLQIIAPSPCSECASVDIVATVESAVLSSKHGDVLGSYRRRDDLVNNRTSYEHASGRFFLFYSAHSQGFWAVSEQLNTDVVRLENQGDAECPHKLKSTWKYADGALKTFVFDDRLKVVCLEDPCSVANCGHQASCFTEQNSTVCRCEEGFSGNPYERCFPTFNSTNSTGDECACQRLIFSTKNSVALAKHSSSYGEYFLFGTHDGGPVYQHFAGVEYLYQRDGNWLISDEVGLREAGLQNQGDASTKCPYRFRTAWEYADVEHPGWQWVYDYAARLVCPTDVCSLTKCGFHASCSEENGQGVCACDEGFEGNAYRRCFPRAEFLSGCDCKELTLSSIGASALAQADKMGSYFLYSIYNGRPAYQHRSGLDFLYFAEGNAWVIGAKFGGSRVGIVNFDAGKCPYSLESLWKHSVSGKLEVDESLTVECNDFTSHENDDEPESSNTTIIKNDDFVQSPREPTTISPSNATSITTPIPTLVANATAVPSTTTLAPINASTTEKVVTVTPAGTHSTLFAIATNSTTPATETETSSRDPSTEIVEDSNINLFCPCKEIFVNSSNAAAIDKHGSQLGKYILYGEKGGRPIYKHERREQYLYYHTYSGGNWLINNEVGLLYGGIQNSKDFPICPYLINTVWQFGDSELGGWVYDRTLTVTCPTNQCSVLRCGFRALCMEDDTGKAHCVCRHGFQGDPNVRCFPNQVPPNCPCKHLSLQSEGPAKDHQKDKMGDYFLWGYYNDLPVYQHYSGLDFLYFHKNNVWGVGPKIGGNSAGLLNFGTFPCPYTLVTPWEFGTKDKSLRRQVDPTTSLKCVLLPQKEEEQIIPPSRSTSSVESVDQCGVRSVTSNPSKLLSQQSDKSVTYGSLPWQANIAVMDPQSGLRHLCSGVVVSSKFVLTVASCLTEQPMVTFRVLLADHDLRQRDEHERAYSVQSIYIHDDFDESANDIALIKLKAPQQFDLSVRAICLPGSELDTNSTLACEVSSWESSPPLHVLSATAVPIVKEPLCAGQVCAGIFQHDMECRLRKGTPLTCSDSNRASTIIGLLSRLPNCSGSAGGTTNEFVEVARYSDWIGKILKL